MRAATFRLLALVVMNLCALPQARAMKADTMWTKVWNYTTPVLSPDDRLVGATYNYDKGNMGFVWWDLRTGAEVWRLPTVDIQPELMHFTPDAKSVIVYRTHGYEKYDLSERTRLEFESDGDTSDYDPGMFRINDISADGTVFMSTKRSPFRPNEEISSEITLWDVQTGRIIRKVSIPNLNTSTIARRIRFSADNNRLFVYVQPPPPSPFTEQQWQLFDVTTQTLTPLAFSTKGASEGNRTQLVLSPDKTRLAVFSRYQGNTLLNGVRILDGTSFAPIAFLPTSAPFYDINGGCFSSDNTKYVTSGGEGWEIWDTEHSRREQSLRLQYTGGDEVWITGDKRYLTGGLAGFILAVDRSIDTTVSHVGDPGSTPILYPNPSTHSVHIPTTTAIHSGFVLDIIPMASGQSISYDPTLLRRTPDELVVDVSSLASGTYLFRLRAPGVEPVAVNVAVER